jgi:hypothetical protein
MQKVFKDGSRRRFGVLAATLIGATALMALVFAASSPVAFAAADHFVVSAPATAVTGVPFDITITANDGTATDTAYGGDHTITLTGPSDAPDGTSFSPNEPISVNFTEGVGSVSVTLVDAETTTLTATDEDSVTGESSEIAVSPADPTHFAVADPGAQTAGTPFNVAITAQDQYDNIDTNYADSKSIAFSGPGDSPNSSKPTYPETVTFTADAGSASITLVKAETTALTADDGAGVSGSLVSLTVGPAAANHFALADPGSQTAGVGFDETIRALDPYDNIDTNYDGSKALAFSGPHPSPNSTAPSYPSSVGFTDGVGSASITLYDAESTTLTATLAISGTSDSFTVGPAPASHFRLATVGQQTAGVVFSEGITALDPYDNVDTNYDGSKALVFSGPHSSPNATAPSYPSSVGFTDGLGSASITLYDAETTTLTATLSISGTSNSFTVVPAAPATLTFVQQPPETQVATTINDGTGVQVRGNDAYGNGTYNSDIKIALAPGSASGTLTGTTTKTPDSSGLATFNDLKIDTVGIYKLRATSPPTSPTATRDSNGFIIAQTVATCGTSCSPTGSVQNNSTVAVQANFISALQSGTASAATSSNSVGIALFTSGAGATPPSGVCFVDKKHAFVPATGLAGTYVNITGNGSQLTITWTIVKAIVNAQADNGAAHYNICLGAVAPFTTKSGMTTIPAPDATGTKTLNWGVIPDCKSATGPCMKSRSKNAAGDVILVYVIPQAWTADPGSYGG